MKNAESKSRKVTAGQKKVAPRRSKKKTEEATKPTIPLMGFVTWTDPLRKPEVLVIQAPFDPETEIVCLHLDFKLRSIASIEVRAARRPLKDVEGTVNDAIRLAHS